MPASARLGRQLTPYARSVGPLLGRVGRGAVGLSARLLWAIASFVGAACDGALVRVGRWWRKGGRSTLVDFGGRLHHHLARIKERVVGHLTSASSLVRMAERAPDGLPEGAVGAVVEVASFRLLARLGEWDEVLDILQLTGRQEIIAVTTTEDGSALRWIAYSPSPLLIRSPVQAPGEVPIRRPPMGVPGLSVNWMCTPPDAGSLFDPSPEEMLALRADAAAIEQHLVRVGLSEDRITQLGPAAGPMVEVVPCPGGMQVAPAGGPQLPEAFPRQGPLLGGAPAVAAVPTAAVAAGGLGFPGDGGIGRDQMSLDDMRASIRAIRRDLKQNDRDSRKKKKKKDDRSRSPKKDKKKKKDKKAVRSKKKKKKHRKGSGSSGSSRSSSTTTSRSSSSSSSSSSTVGGRYVWWRPSGPNRKIKVEELSRFATRKFRDQSEVVAFAARNCCWRISTWS